VITMGASKTFMTVLCDLVILGVMLTTLMVVKYVPNPTQNGFFCSDLSIRHPYFSSTIPTSINVTTSYGVGILLILFTRRTTRGWLVRLGKVWSDTRCFLMGGLATQVISGVCKKLAGRLRPHFIAVCNPSITLDESNCGPSFSPIYLTDFTCEGNTELFPDLGKREHRASETRLSFLSGHASISSYGMMFAILYITFNYRRKISPVVLMMFQVLFMIYMISVGISRVTDNKHHPTDVIAGMVLGSIMAIVTIHGFRESKEEKEDDKKEIPPTQLIQQSS